MEMAKIGPGVAGGNNRQTLTDEDGEGRRLFKKWCDAAGLETGVDEMGTMFARREGTDPTLAPVYVGSHLDTQPTGGKYDGILGTLAALEVVRTLNAAGIETETPICVCNWTNEEGSRYAPAMMASAAYAGDYTTDDILSRKDADGITVAEALDSIGYRGADPVGKQKFSAFVELHIEQGPLLEAENKTIGVVDRGQGIMWYDGTIAGFASHAGTTPMPLRKDALAAFSEVVLAVERIARDHGPNAVGTIGEIKIDNPSRNVIPGDLNFTVDIRSSESRILDSLHAAIQFATAEIASRRKVRIDLKQIWRKEPTVFNTALVDAVEAAAKEMGYSYRRITSGAGHDACNLATVIPAAMIFVPCKDGISHNELEDATEADCAAGANVLLHAVLALAGVASGAKVAS
jgi:N-carbamoyl-L-amino-acid hydrolase